MKTRLVRLTMVTVATAVILAVWAVPAAAQSEVWVDDDYGSGTPGWGTTHFASIQAGVTAVDPGGTVHVAAGSYNESVTIDKSLALRGAKADVDARGRSVPPGDPAESTVISSTNTIVATSSASDVTINGFSIIGYRAAVDIQSPQTDFRCNVVSPSSAGAGSPPALMHIHGGTVSTAYLQYNDISPTPTGSWPSGANAVRFADTSGATIRVYDNRLHNSSHHTGALGAGIGLVDNVSATVRVVDNELNDNGSDGIFAWGPGGATFASLAITSNDIHDNGEMGVKIWSGVSGTVEVHYNNIENNGTYGVYNHSSGPPVVVATKNYWGDSGGPYDAYGTTPCPTGYVSSVNSSGSGNGVSDASQADQGWVEYCGWATERYASSGGAQGGCFIATSACGPDDDSVRTLRSFRDTRLNTDSLGSGFVSAYYRLSPPVAGFIDDHPALKPVVRAGLMPAAAVSSATVSLTLAQKLGIAMSMMVVSILPVVGLRRRRVSVSGGDP